MLLWKWYNLALLGARKFLNIALVKLGPELITEMILITGIVR